MENLQNCPVCGSNDLEIYMETQDYFLTQEKFSIVECKACSFKFTNPRPLENELAKYYKSEAYISHSDSSEGLFNKVYQKVRKYTLCKKYKLITDFKAKGKILDIGCASGNFLSIFKENGWETVGVEPNEEIREYAKNKFGLNVYPEDYLKQMPENEFDVITMWHVLEHVFDLDARMRDLKRLLKKDGILIIAVPNADCLDAQIYDKYWAAYDVPRHLYHFTQKSIETLLANYDFKIKEIKPMIFDAYYVSLLSEKYRNKKMNWIHAISNGFKSNLNSLGKNNQSSLIFVVQNSEKLK